MSDHQGKYNEVISALLAEGILSADKIQYAERVLSKLKGDYKLLDVLKKLRYISDDDIWNAVQKKRVSTRLGNLLVELGYISQQQLESAIEVQKKERENKSAVTLVSGFENISDSEFAVSKALELGYQHIEPDFDNIPPELITKCRPEWYESHRFFPVSSDNGIITVAFVDPSEANCLDAAKEFFGEDLQPVIVRADLVTAFTARYRNFVQSGSIFLGSGSVGKGAFNSIVSAAIDKDDVTDIYIEPMKDRLVIKFRHSCLVRKHQELPPQIKASIFNYLREAGQTGLESSGIGISHEFHHEKGTFLLSGKIFHTKFGDSAFIHITKQDLEPPSLNDLPMNRYVSDFLRSTVVDNNSGFFMICGTESSAKKVLLYSMLKQKKKNAPDSRIALLGDSFPYHIDDAIFCYSDSADVNGTMKVLSDSSPDVIGITGIHTFNSSASILRSASNGVQTIATGRYIGVTEALNPFFDSGLIPQLASTLSGVLSLKIMRRICPICVTPIAVQVDLLRKIGLNPNDFSGLKPMKGVGCKACGNSGYNGILIAAEIVSADERLKEGISDLKNSYSLKKYLISSPGYVSLVEDAMLWAADGQTTIEEIARVFPRNQKTRTLSELQKIRGV